MSYKQRYPDEFYLTVDWFGPDDCDKECMSSKIVTTRAEHECVFSGYKHKIPTGEKAWRESGKVEGRFGSCYSCLKCLDQCARRLGLRARGAT